VLCDKIKEQLENQRFTWMKMSDTLVSEMFVLNCSVWTMDITL